MILQTATLIDGTLTPVGEGLRGSAHRCVLRLTDGSLQKAVLKRMALPAVLAEAFSALLLRGWGLTVPEPFLVAYDGTLAFASVDATYPSLSQRMGLNTWPDGPLKEALINAACTIVSNLAQTPLALTADEAIDNRDRNLGNILWDGQTAAWIDHELALGLGSDRDDVNKLAAMVVLVSAHDTIRQSAIAAWMAIDRSLPTAAAIAAGTPNLDVFVAQRLSQLGNRLLARFPEPQDLLSPP